MRFVPSVVTQNLGRTTLMAQKSSPEILLAAGVVGMVGATVLACRATLKMHDILDEAQENIQKTEMAIEISAKNAELRHYDKGTYTVADQRKDIMLIKYQTGIKIVRAYAPAIVLGGISIYALTSSHRILSKRNIALTAAYGALEKGFAEYRARVVEKYGEDQDEEFRYGSTNVAITDPGSGKTTTVTRVDPDAIADGSIYARFFDQTSSCWEPDAEYNLFFLKSVQNYANDLLHARGHVFLNEVYDRLDIPRSHAGAIVGWYLSKNGETDNFIDFGVWRGDSQIVRDFVNGREGAILLDFNVDGLIWDKF